MPRRIGAGSFSAKTTVYSSLVRPRVSGQLNPVWKPTLAVAAVQDLDHDRVQQGLVRQRELDAQPEGERIVDAGLGVVAQLEDTPSRRLLRHDELALTSEAMRRHGVGAAAMEKLVADQRADDRVDPVRGQASMLGLPARAAAGLRPSAATGIGAPKRVDTGRQAGGAQAGLALERPSVVASPVVRARSCPPGRRAPS